VVGWWDRCGGGRAAVRLKKQGEGVWAKILKPSRRGSILAAPCETVMGRGGLGWCGGVVDVVVAVRPSSQKCEGRGFGPKPRKRAIEARFRAAIGVQEAEGGHVVSLDPPPW
jgi:hypothetical protein